MLAFQHPDLFFLRAEESSLVSLLQAGPEQRATFPYIHTCTHIFVLTKEEEKWGREEKKEEEKKARFRYPGPLHNLSVEFFFSSWLAFLETGFFLREAGGRGFVSRTHCLWKKIARGCLSFFAV